MAPLWQVSAWLVSLEGVTKECQNSTLRGNKILPICTKAIRLSQFCLKETGSTWKVWAKFLIFLKFVSRWDVMKKKKVDDRWIFKVFWTKVRLENQLTSLIWFVAFKSINWHYIKLGLALPIVNSNWVWKGNALCRLESELFWTAFILVPY